MSPAGELIVERVRTFLEAQAVGRGELMLVGFSGGRDSVVLAESLLGAGWRRLVLCHIDHGLRVASAADAVWAEEYARVRGVDFRGAKRDVRAMARERGIGVEGAGREARMEFFSEVLREVGAGGVLLGHHADDQVETLLFRLMRGSGVVGLGGMAPSKWRTDLGLRVVRPLLSTWRSEIDAMVEGEGLAFCEDASNADLEWTRNRIRHGLIPEMERVMGRSVRGALWRAAALLRAEGECLEALDAVGGEPRAEFLEVEELRVLALALRRRRVLGWLRGRGVADVGFEEVEAVLGLLERERPAKVNMPGGVFVRRRAGRIFLDEGRG